MNKTRCCSCFLLDNLCHPLLWVAHWIYWIYCLDLAVFLSFFLSFFFLLITNFKWLLLKKNRYFSWPCLHFSLIQALYLWTSFQFKQYTSELLFSSNYVQLNNVFISRSTLLKFIIRLNLDDFSCRYQLVSFD